MNSQQNAYAKAKPYAAGIALRKPEAKKGWQTILQDILNTHNAQKASGKGNTSFRTREARAQGLFMIFNTLTKQLKFKVENPHNLKEKHIQALVTYWVSQDLATATMDSYLSFLRVFAEWAGKNGMVKALSFYAPGYKRTFAAQRDKSLTGNNIDFTDLWQKISDMDERVGMQMLLVNAFGARRKEAVMFKPIIHDKTDYIELYDGTKGGRARCVRITNNVQRICMAALKNYVLKKSNNPKAHIGHPDKTLAQNLKRYNYVLGKCGLNKKELGTTGHGLRAEFVINELIKRGVVPTIRGGTGQAHSKEATKLARLMVAEDLGHSRDNIIAAYAGALIIRKHDGKYQIFHEESLRSASEKKKTVIPGQASLGFDDPPTS